MPEEVAERKPASASFPATAEINTRKLPATRSTDKWAQRRAELKRKKRRAHRRKINASNTPG